MKPSPLPTLADEILAALPALIAAQQAGVTILAICKRLSVVALSVRAALKQLNIDGRADLMRRRSSRELFIVPRRYRHADGLRCCVCCGKAFELRSWAAPSRHRREFSQRRTCSPSCATRIGARNRDGHFISQEQKDRCISLRLEHQLSAPAIAKKVGISTHSAYRLLKPYPWRAPAKRPAYRGKAWEDADDLALRRLYPTAEQDDIMRELPGHTWLGIERRASFLKVRRRRAEARRNGNSVHPIIAKLLSHREQNGISRTALAKRCGIAHGQILGWELGKTEPDFGRVCRWARGLGFEIVLASTRATA